MCSSADAAPLPTLLTSRRSAPFDDKVRSGLLEISVPQECLPTLPEAYPVPVRVRNTFIDIGDEEEQLVRDHMVHSAPARHAGRVEQLWREFGSSEAGVPTSLWSPAGTPPPVQAEPRPSKPVLRLIDVLYEPVMPGAPESHPAGSVGSQPAMSDQMTLPAGSTTPAAAPAAAAALGLVNPTPAFAVPAAAHGVYSQRLEMQVFDSSMPQQGHLQWAGPDAAATHPFTYGDCVASGVSSMPQQQMPGEQAHPSLNQVGATQTCMRADAPVWYSNNSNQGDLAAGTALQILSQCEQVPTLNPSFGPVTTPAPAEPAPGSAELPSIGSQPHSIGHCKPCAFLHAKGCDNGAVCKFCHLCEPGEKKRRQKEKRQMLRSGA